MMSGSVISQMNLDSFIRDRVQNGYSHAAIASELQLIHPGIAGLSRRSVTRHCSQHNIHYASRLPREQLDDLVEQAVSRVLQRLIDRAVTVHAMMHAYFHRARH